MKTPFPLPLLLLVVLPWFAPCTGTAQTVRIDGRSLVIKDGTQRIRLKDALNSIPSEHTVYKVIKRGADYYLVLGLSEWSRGAPQERGRCAVGLEEYIAWLHVRDGKITERQSGLYMSCLKDIDGDVVGWENGVLRWEAEYAHRVSDAADADFVTTDYTWTFDPARPEAGITEHKTDTPGVRTVVPSSSPSRP